MRARWSMFMVLIVAVLVCGASVGYTRYVQHQADLRWCALLDSLDQPQVPATSPRGQQVQAQIHELRRSLGCEGAQ